jgi:hypothetical protein
MMEKLDVARFGLGLTEPASFALRSGMFLFFSAATLYVLLAAHYPAIHDTMHNIRHALAVVPCH